MLLLHSEYKEGPFISCRPEQEACQVAVATETSTTVDVKALKRLVLDRSSNPVVREILETLLQYFTQELPNRGPQSQEKRVNRDSVCRSRKKSSGSNASQRLTTFQLLQSKFLLAAPKPAVTNRREVGSLNVKGLKGTKEVDRASSDIGRGVKGGRSRVQDVIAKFAAVEQKERGLETKKVPQKLIRQISKGPLLSGIMKKFEALAKVHSRTDLTESKKPTCTGVIQAKGKKDMHEQKKAQDLGSIDKQQCFQNQGSDDCLGNNNVEEIQAILPAVERTQCSSTDEQQDFASEKKNNFNIFGQLKSDVIIMGHINSAVEISDQVNNDADVYDQVTNDAHINDQVNKDILEQVNDDADISSQLSDNVDIMDQLNSHVDTAGRLNNTVHISGQRLRHQVNDDVDISGQLNDNVDTLDKENTSGQLNSEVDILGQSLNDLKVLQRKVRYGRVEIIGFTTVVENSDYELHCALVAIEIPKRRYLATVVHKPDVWVMANSSKSLIEVLEHDENKCLASINCLDQPYEKWQTSEHTISKNLDERPLTMEQSLQLHRNSIDVPCLVQGLSQPFKPLCSESPKEQQFFHSSTVFVPDKDLGPQQDVPVDSHKNPALPYKDENSTAEQEVLAKCHESPLHKANNKARNAGELKLEEGQGLWVKAQADPSASLILQRGPRSLSLEWNVAPSNHLLSELPKPIGTDSEIQPDGSMTFPASVPLNKQSDSTSFECYDSDTSQDTSHMKNPCPANVCFDSVNEDINHSMRDIPSVRPKSVEASSNTLKERTPECSSCSPKTLHSQHSQFPQIKEGEKTQDRPKYRTVNYSDASAKTTYVPKIIRFTDTFNF